MIDLVVGNWSLAEQGAETLFAFAHIPLVLLQQRRSLAQPVLETVDLAIIRRYRLGGQALTEESRVVFKRPNLARQGSGQQQGSDHLEE